MLENKTNREELLQRFNHLSLVDANEAETSQETTE